MWNGMDCNDMRLIVIDKAEVTHMGKLRQQVHTDANNSSQRFFTDKNEEDIIGISVELAFEKRYGLLMDRSLKPYGDDHVDFRFKWRGHDVTLDVKGARKPYNLLIKEWEIEKAAKITVLAGFNDFKVWFIGWEFRDIMATMPIKVFHWGGIRNYYRHASELRPMEKLEQMLKERQ